MDMVEQNNPWNKSITTVKITVIKNLWEIKMLNNQRRVYFRNIKTTFKEAKYQTSSVTGEAIK